MSGNSNGSGPSTTGSNASNPLAAAIDSVIATGAAMVMASAPGPAYLWTPGGAFPSVPAGQYGSVSITGTVSGTAVLPVPYNVVTDDTTGAVTVFANGTSPQVASLPGAGQTYGAQNGAGFFISGNFQVQGSPTPGTGSGQGGNLWFIGASGSTESYLASDGRADTIVALRGDNGIATGINSHDLIWVDAGDAVIASRGADTIAVAAAADSVAVVASGDALAFAGRGKTVFLAIGGANSLVGTAGAVSAAATGSASLLAYGASVGGNALLGDGAAATLVGGGNGDTLAGVVGQNVLVAAGGNETLFAASTSQVNVLIGGSGTDLMASDAGGSMFVAGTGLNQVIASGNANAFDFIFGKAGGTMLVVGFNDTDAINLSGYAPGAATTALNTAHVSGGNTTITLADNTKITLFGFTGLAAHNIVA